METQNKQQLAKDLYLQADKTQTEIADILDVNRKTIYLWCKKGKWEETKIAIRQAPGAILQTLYNHIGEVNKKIAGREDHCPTIQEVDMLGKLLRMTKGLAKKNTGFYIEAFEELSFFIGTDDKPFMDKYTKHVSEFVQGTFGDQLEWPGYREAHENLTTIRENLAKQANMFPEDLAQQELEVDALAEQDGATAPTEQLTGKNGASVAVSLDPSKPATANTSRDEIIEGQCPILEIKKLENNGTSVGAIPCGCPAFGNSASPAAPLPTAPARPAPFREGNIIWINHPKDLDGYEKHLKMSDSIRYYPDMDPSRIYNKAK